MTTKKPKTLEEIKSEYEEWLMTADPKEYGHPEVFRNWLKNRNYPVNMRYILSLSAVHIRVVAQMMKESFG